MCITTLPFRLGTRAVTSGRVAASMPRHLRAYGQEAHRVSIWPPRSKAPEDRSVMLPTPRCTPRQWRHRATWLRAPFSNSPMTPNLDEIAALRPTVVIAGHKKVEKVPDVGHAADAARPTVRPPTGVPEQWIEARWTYILPTPAGLGSRGTPSEGLRHRADPTLARKSLAGGSWRPLA